MKKFVFKKQRPALDPSEIRNHMDFDRFLKSRHAVSKRWIIKSKFLMIAGISAVTGVLLFTLFNKNHEDHILKSFIAPPVPALDVPADKIIVAAQRDTTILFRTGSLISIPSGSFEDENGKIVSDSVEIRYREFHDAVDILCSGIPMNYDSAGITYQLESAGMMQIEAYRNNKPLRLRSGHPLTVNMISASPDRNSYNIYLLDTTARKWNYVAENTAANYSCFPVYEDLHPDRRKKSGQPEYAKAPVRPRLATKHATSFMIDYDSLEFPELASLSGIRFEPLHTIPAYKKLSGKIWEDVRITRSGDADQYVVTFTEGKEKLQIDAVPVVDEKNYADAMKKFAIRQSAYTARLKARLAEKEASEDSLCRINAQFRSRATNSDMTARFEDFINDSYTAASRDLLVYRTFAVSRLGVWNCDRPCPFFSAMTQHIQKGARIASFYANGAELDMKYIYFVKRKINSIYSVTPSSFRRFPQTTEPDVMIGITYDNKLFYLKDEDLHNSDKGGNVRFNMKEVDNAIVNASELKKLFLI